MEKIITNISSVIDRSVFPPVEFNSNEVQTVVNINPDVPRNSVIVSFYNNCCSKRCCCSSYPENFYTNTLSSYKNVMKICCFCCLL